ncbi:Dihydropteroate synthase [Ferrimonas balearica DSM 9799]|uniref:Dihydropteroate synthase n=1 Tax=Ferrimonas balearica (strain DSM 9799 / CCM 4581 / KCTC 23876 / PAT) TaxID=550540 RepID=E1SSS7_FERBD|nr:dihydropteroate synthase [Ferrimonas balearica]ADN77081.1 Dihydropteroate synthase [Ferrimonas balearica DSM 9799]
MKLSTGQRSLDLSQPRIMGIVNVTPDSFSDGGRHHQRDAAVAHALMLVEQGATILDIGGESTRPGAADVALADELSRTIPVIEALRGRIGDEVLISIDTSKAEVMRQAVAAGADLINDVRALREPGALEAAAETDALVCLMHMQGQPRTMQQEPHYEDLFGEVTDFLAERVAACEQAGIGRERLILDPGFGFGKTQQHNYRLLANLAPLQALGLPLLIGLSRKRMIGDLLNRPMDQRAVGSVTASLLAVQQGAELVRVHDVAEMRDALMVWQATRAQQ